VTWRPQSKGSKIALIGCCRKRSPAAPAAARERQGVFAVLAIGLAETAAAQQAPPIENKGLNVSPISGFDLSKQGLKDLDQRQMRIRQIKVEPGGVAGFHSHAQRPALTYVLSGTFVEHRKGAPDRTYKAGEVITESTDVEHWGENKGGEPAVLISVDLFKELPCPSPRSRNPLTGECT
jgi:quercetin dioxygenase-like cupin family protein